MATIDRQSGLHRAIWAIALPSMLTNVATACAAQGRADEALRYFTLVLDRDPANAAARGNLALLQRQLARMPY